MERKDSRRPWSRNEHVLAFNLYCKIPFGTIHMRNPRIIELAGLIGRSIGAVSYKLANFARLDPAQQARGVNGLQHGAKGEIDTWNEFIADPEALVYESERLLSELSGETLEDFADIAAVDFQREGLEREGLARLRVNQSFFRKAVLAAYDFRCCVTGISVPELLVASHILPWSSDIPNRLNPSNGLCLNALHDRAFDRGLMTVTGSGIVRFHKSLRSHLSDDNHLTWLLSFEGKRIRMPSRFRPSPAFLNQHSQQICSELESK